MMVQPLQRNQVDRETDNKLAVASFASQRARTQGLRRKLLGRMPKPIKRRLRSAFEIFLDGLDVVLRRRRDLVPPRYLNFVGDGDYEETGNEFLRYFVDLGGLRPDHKVLEIGCGIGRMARPLTRYLTSGSYEGIDIVHRGIRWCQENITKRHPHFRFQLADIRNLQYNSQGKLDPAEYRFPFQDNEFDFVFLTSVFTHMLTPEVNNYSHEIVRMLRSKGTCLATFFLLNKESRELINAGQSSLNFPYSRGGCWVFDDNAPEDSVAYEESVISQHFSRLGLGVSRVEYGAWCGRSRYLSYQDLVVVTKA
jgi:SAM-dependent methyltransferase